MAVGQATSFPVVLRELEGVLVTLRRDLAGLIDLANAMPLVAPMYTRESEQLARRIARLEEHAELIERLFPAEDRTRALAAYCPMEARPEYEPPSPTDKFYDGRSVLVVGAASWDMGPEVKVMFSLGRVVTVGRGEIAGVRRR